MCLKNFLPWPLWFSWTDRSLAARILHTNQASGNKGIPSHAYLHSHYNSGTIKEMLFQGWREMTPAIQWAAKRASVKNQDHGNLAGGGGRAGCVPLQGSQTYPQKNTVAFFRFMRWLIILLETSTLHLSLKPSFPEVFLFKLQISFFPLTSISSSNCSTIAFQFHPPGPPFKQPSLRTFSKVPLSLHRDLQALPALPLVQDICSCFCHVVHFYYFLNAVTPLRTTVSKLSAFRSADN